MVIFQVRIEKKKRKGGTFALDAKADILLREDAVEEEKAMADCFEARTIDIMEMLMELLNKKKGQKCEVVHYSNITARWYPMDIVVTERCEVLPKQEKE